MSLEATYVALLCSLLGGAEPETSLEFDVYGYDRPREVRVDRETPTHVIEIGLDERVSARDSVHQAVFAATLTGKSPWIILIDTNWTEGRYEQEMRHVTEYLGLSYTRCSAGLLERWVATAGLRVRPTVGGDNLPSNATLSALCPMDRVISTVPPSVSVTN